MKKLCVLENSHRRFLMFSIKCCRKCVAPTRMLRSCNQIHKYILCIHIYNAYICAYMHNVMFYVFERKESTEIITEKKHDKYWQPIYLRRATSIVDTLDIENRNKKNKTSRDLRFYYGNVRKCYSNRNDSPEKWSLKQYNIVFVALE